MIKLKKHRVLIVDDTPENIHILVEILKGIYDIQVALTGERALQLANGDPAPDIILLDIMMPGMDGYEVCRRLKENRHTRGIPVVFITAMNMEENEARGLEIGAVDYITKPFRARLVQSRLHNHLELKCYQDKLKALLRNRTKELELTQDATIESLGMLAESRDPETGFHIRRTSKYVRVLSAELQKQRRFSGLLTDSLVDKICKSAPLHDIGKVGIPDSILLKPGKLTEEEFAEMKKHTGYGREAIEKSTQKLGSNSFLEIAKEIIYSHHEKWDGTGYPEGLKGHEIPVSGRIMAVADVYDALTSARVYREALPHEQAVEIMLAGKNKHFDPDILDAFLAVEDIIKAIAREEADVCYA